MAKAMSAGLFFPRKALQPVEETNSSATQPIWRQVLQVEATPENPENTENPCVLERIRTHSNGRNIGLLNTDHNLSTIGPTKVEINQNFYSLYK